MTTFIGLVLLNDHFFNAALRLNVIFPRFTGSSSPLLRLANDGLAFTFVRSRRQALPFTRRLEAVSCPARCGAAVEPVIVPAKFAVPYSPSGGLPGALKSSAM